MKNKISGSRILALLLALMLILSVWPTAAFAKENKTVKVGVYPLNGFHSFEKDGSCKGYDLLSPSQMTSDRLDEFSFSTFPIGKVYAAILAAKDTTVIYEDMV